MTAKKTTKKPAAGKAQNRTRGATSGQAILALKRKLRAVDLKVENKSYAEIGDDLGISRQAAHKLVMSAIQEEKEELSEKTEHLIVLSNKRLLRLMAKYFPEAEKGDLGAFNAQMKLEERFAKLNGLDAAARTEISGPGGAPLATGVFAVPFTAPSVGDWTSQALALAASEEDTAEALLGGGNASSPPKE